MPNDPTCRLVFGVGKLDVHPVINKGVKLRAYRVWFGMLKRCYGKGTAFKSEYQGCSVDDHWHQFSNFQQFYDKNYFEGAELDKDLLYLGNKVYSKDRCVFIPPFLNAFITVRPPRNNNLPIGVYQVSNSRKYQSEIQVNGERKYLGIFEDPHEAHSAWFNEKLKMATSYKELCDSLHPDLYGGLITKIESMRVYPD